MSVFKQSDFAAEFFCNCSIALHKHRETGYRGTVKTDLVTSRDDQESRHRLVQRSRFAQFFVPLVRRELVTLEAKDGRQQRRKREISGFRQKLASRWWFRAIRFTYSCGSKLQKYWPIFRSRSSINGCIVNIWISGFKTWIYGRWYLAFKWFFTVKLILSFVGKT